jgi:hypothetical protein
VPYFICSNFYKKLICEDFSGPNKLPTRFVFDLKLALSFNCQTKVCCFITTNCSVTSLLLCYGYIGHLGALTCSFLSQNVSICIS